MRSAVSKGAPSAVETLGEIGNRAAEVTQHPLDPRMAFGHAGKDELRRGQRRIEQEADEWHQPVIGHRFDANGTRRMNVQHGAQAVRLRVQWLKSLVGESNAVDVAEEHRSREMQLLDRAAQLRH